RLETVGPPYKWVGRTRAQGLGIRARGVSLGKVRVPDRFAPRFRGPGDRATRLGPTVRSSESSYSRCDRGRHRGSDERRQLPWLRTVVTGAIRASARTRRPRPENQSRLARVFRNGHPRNAEMPRPAALRLA